MQYNSQIKSDYIHHLILSGDLEAAQEKSALNDYDPLFKLRQIHSEDEPRIKEFNEMLLESLNDLTVLHHEIMCGATQIKELADSISARLQRCHNSLLKEKELRDDIQLLCQAYTEFEDVVPVEDSIDVQNCDYRNGIFRSKVVGNEKLIYDILDITGNGIPGNNYVLTKDGTFLKDKKETHLPKALKDGDKHTAYEYQRITVDSSEKEYTQNMFKEEAPARCVITLESQKVFNECFIHTSQKDLYLSGMKFSSDGLTYIPILSKPIYINQATSSTNYINHSGFFAFPSAKYVQLTFENNGFTDDKIGFKKSTYVPKTNNNYTLEETLVKVESAKRHLVALNEIELMRNTYQNSSYFKTGNLLKHPVKAVALYGLSYIPEHFKTDNYITYRLSINGIEHDVLPINSQSNGIKIIKTSEVQLGQFNSLYINEPIRDARVTIIFKNPSLYETAAVGHLRLLIGEGSET